MRTRLNIPFYERCLCCSILRIGILKTMGILQIGIELLSDIDFQKVIFHVVEDRKPRI